jgi:hypothetical protein
MTCQSSGVNETCGVLIIDLSMIQETKISTRGVKRTTDTQEKKNILVRK